MKVTKDNYEIYFLDYYDGNLTAGQQAELFLFLEQNPQLKNEFENFEQINISSNDETIFPDKKSLKKEFISEKNYQQYLIGKLEGDLNKEEQHQLNKFLFQHPEFKKDEKLFVYTKIVADENIVFPNKAQLKKTQLTAYRNKKAFYLYVAAAASIVLLIGVYFMNRNTGARNMQAVNESKKESNQILDIKEEIVENTVHIKEKPLQIEKPLKTQLASKQKNTRKESSQEKYFSKDAAEKIESNSVTDEKISAVVKTESLSDSSLVNQQHKFALINPSLIKKSMIKQLEKDPSSYNAKEFDAYLDKVSDPDSAFTANDLEQPVFASVEPLKKVETPILDALAWGINKVSGKDIILNKNYNHLGELVAYSLASGKLKIGKPTEK